MNILALLLVIIPLVSAPLAWLFKRGLREWFSVAAVLAVFILSVFLYRAVAEAPLHYDLFNVTDNVIITINLDLLSIVIITLYHFWVFLQRYIQQDI